ncbi:MAG TPA: hypothetical protein VFN55_08665 [Solirubrobacteraceae bacterium]|nr:hypothetical protein [Solirubrobacteraceae bacterium]
MRRAYVVALVLTAALTIAPRALAAPGDLDPSFGSAGIVLTPAGSPGDTSAADIARQPDGKFVVAGTGTGGSGTPVTKVARYTSSGALDPSFGDSGSGVTTIGPFAGATFNGSAVGLQPGTGDVIVAGTLLPAGATTGDFALVRLRGSDGALDTSFGSGGIVDIPIGDAHSALDRTLAIDPSSGEMFLGGTAQSGGTGDFAVAAVDASGAAESGFGTAGHVLTAVPGGDAQIESLVLDGSGLVVAGTAQSGSAAGVMRYTANGGADPSFDGGGPAIVPIGTGSASAAYSALVQSDDKIVVGGYGGFSGGSCLALARLNQGGGLDTTFGHGTGVSHMCLGQFSAVNAITSGPDGIDAAGYEVTSSGSTRLVVARFTADGTPDAGFGTGGQVTSDPAGAGNDSQANAIVLDGVHPVIAGEAAEPTRGDFVIERFTGGTPPANTSTPTLNANATPTAGQQLTASPGSWSGTQPIDFTYTWLRCPGASSAGCTSAQSGPASSYTLTDADAGHHLIVEVQATNVAGSAGAESAATASVLAPPANLAPPAVSGTPRVLQTLTASPGAWSGSQPISYSYAWLSCPGAADSGCDPVQTGPSPTYRLALSDASRRIAVRVTATNAVGSATALSSFTAAVDFGDLKPPTLTGCGQHVTIGPISATGCFDRKGDTWVASGEVSINGISLKPDAAGAQVVFDPRKLTITSTGVYTFQLGPVEFNGQKWGPWLVDKGKFRWDFSLAGLPHLTLPARLPTVITLPGAFEHALPAITIPRLPGLSFLGLPVVGTPTIKPAGGGMTITLPVGLPKVLGITGQVVLTASESQGLRFGGASVAVPDLMLGPVELKKTDLAYQPDDNSWHAETSIVLPTPNHNAVGASVDIVGGHLKSISAQLANAQIPIGPGAMLQSLAGSLSFSPLHIGGSIGMTAGPQIAGAAAARIDGSLSYDLGDQASNLAVGGTLTLAGLKLGNATLDYVVDHGAWSIKLAGQLGYLYTIKGPYGTSATIGAAGALTGNIYGGRDFYADAVAQVQAPLLKAQGEVRANGKALAGCAAIGNGWGTLAGGFVYPWGGHPQLFTGCDLGPYVADAHASAASATAARSVRLAAGLPMAAIKVSGAGGPPLLRVHGPRGASLVMPATAPGVKSRRYLAYRDPQDSSTYLLINHPAAGRWTVSAAPGSPPITGVQTADGLPAPRIHARVVARGRRRALRYMLRPLRGQTVRLLERGRGVARVLGTARGSRGTIRIPSSGPAGRRTIVAEVVQNGVPRATLIVARYPAPGGAMRLPAPARVRAVRHGAVLTVRFAPVRSAAHYVVRVSTQAGTSQTILPGGRLRTTVPGILPQARALISVRALDRFGAPGRARTTLVRARHVRR